MPILSIQLNEKSADQWRQFETAVSDMAFNLRPDDPATKALKTGFALSPFVARIALRRPETAVDLIESGDLTTAYAEDDRRLRFHRHILNSMEKQADGNLEKILATMGKIQFDQLLRLYRHREMVRIAVRDLAGLADLEEVLKDLSGLADLSLKQALEFLYSRQCLEWGTPRDADGKPQQLVVLGMGKLGAHELNFSSDVDLIFTYPREGQTTDGIKATSNEDFFLRLCRSLIQTVGAKTADGFVFRVDTLLRPFGESGPLVLSFNRMEDYYETHGREWERYALIKARVVAGDEAAGQRLLDNLKPFVFRRYLDYNTFSSLRDMKQRIALEVRTKGLQNNIKIGPGGIREIEFFGQMFQMLRGGVQPELQARPILTILRRLAEHQYISVETEKNLTQAYIFLRRAENRIQSYMDQQCHKLPKTPEEQHRLALAMGFDTWSAFLSTLDQHRAKVHHHFDALLAGGGPDRQAPPANEEKLDEGVMAIWQEVGNDEQAHEILSAMQYTKPDTALKLIRELKGGATLRPMSIMGRERLARILPILVTAAGSTSRPQLVLERLFNLIKSICRRTAYLSLLCEYPAVITHLVTLFEASPWIANLLCRHPVLLDELLDPRTLYSPPKKTELTAELHALLTGIPEDDLEHQLESMRIFKQTNTLRVSASDITNVLPLMKVSDRLSDIAEVVIEKVVDLSWRHLVRKHGTPGCLMDGNPCLQGFAVVAYGKLGGLELGYRSDLDLVFLHAAAPGETRGGPRPIDNGQFFTRLGQRVLHMLSAHTAAGILYETDMRLRPSGDSGMLVCNIEGFRDYHLNDAWTWEHQALIRARAIAGDEAIQKKFEKIRMEVLAVARDGNTLQKEVREMRDRLRQAQAPKPPENTFDIKQDRGGIIDIEFLVQYLILRHAHRHPEITRWTDNVRQIQALSSHGIIDERTAFILRRAYLILRAMGHRLNQKGSPAHVSDDRFIKPRSRIEKFWKAHLDI